MEINNGTVQLDYIEELATGLVSPFDNTEETRKKISGYIEEEQAFGAAFRNKALDGVAPGSPPETERFKRFIYLNIILAELIDDSQKAEQIKI